MRRAIGPALERDMFVLDPIGLAQGAPAPVVYVARGQVAAAVFMENELHERRAAQTAHENATKEQLDAESLIKPPPLARTALKNVALFMEGDLFNSGALMAARGQPIAFYTTAPSSLVSIDQRWIAEPRSVIRCSSNGCDARSIRASATRLGLRREAGAARFLRAPGHLGLGEMARAPARAAHRLQAGERRARSATARGG
jgi:hypothetical protein